MMKKQFIGGILAASLGCSWVWAQSPIEPVTPTTAASTSVVISDGMQKATTGIVASDSAKGVRENQEVTPSEEIKKFSDKDTSLQEKETPMENIAVKALSPDEKVVYDMVQEAGTKWEPMLYALSIPIEENKVAFLFAGGDVSTRAMESAVTAVKQDGTFTRYTMGENYIVTYDGIPRSDGADIKLRPNCISQIHIGDPNFKALNGFVLGEANAGLLYPMFGVPNAVVRVGDPSDEAHFLYIYRPNSQESFKHLFEKLAVGETADPQTSLFLRHFIYRLFQLHQLTVVADVHNERVLSLDYYTSGLLGMSGLTSIRLEKREPGVLTDSDFSIDGVKLGSKEFTSAGQRDSWRGTSGKVWGFKSLQTDLTRALLDDNHVVQYVMSRNRYARTARGITEDMGRSLVLAVYGNPTAVYETFDFADAPGDVVYEYKNLNKPDEFLDFVIGDNHFVKAILLANRPVPEIKTGAKTPEEKQRELFLLYQDTARFESVLPGLVQERRLGL